MKCPKRGNYVPPSDWFCPTCGEEVSPNPDLSENEFEETLESLRIPKLFNQAFEKLIARYETKQSALTNPISSIVHFISERTDSLSFGTKSFIYNDSDFLYIFTKLEKESPWIELNSEKLKLQQYINGKQSFNETLLLDDNLIQSLLDPNKYNLESLYLKIDNNLIKTIEVSANIYEHTSMSTKKKNTIAI